MAHTTEKKVLYDQAIVFDVFWWTPLLGARTRASAAPAVHTKLRVEQKANVEAYVPLSETSSSLAVNTPVATVVKVTAPLERTVAEPGFSRSALSFERKALTLLIIETVPDPDRIQPVHSTAFLDCSSTSLRTIICTSSGNSTLGFHPSTSRALVASPISRSTSAGRMNAGSM